jgi:Peptidase family M23
MKTMVKCCLATLLLYAPVCLFAQKDSLRLICPLNDAVVVQTPKNVPRFDPPDLCIVLTSKPDTVVKACIGAVVTNIERDDEGKYGVVIFSRYNGKDYYFWYTGISTLLVKRSDKLKAGQPLGYIKPGDNIELLMFDFETPVDPVKYLNCSSILRTE